MLYSVILKNLHAAALVATLLTTIVTHSFLCKPAVFSRILNNDSKSWKRIIGVLTSKDLDPELQRKAN